GVVGQANNLGVASFSRADLLVRRVDGPPTHIAGLHRFHALHIVEHGLQAPETSPGKRRYVHRCITHVVCLFSPMACYFVASSPTSLQYEACLRFAWNPLLNPATSRHLWSGSTPGPVTARYRRQSCAKAEDGSPRVRRKWVSSSAASACRPSPPKPIA